VSDDPRVSNYEGCDYGALWEDPRRRHDEAVEPPLIADLLPRSGDWFCDLGCAHGRLADIYLPRFEHCVLLDYSPKHLQAARERLGDRPKTWYIAADVYRLPFRDGIFDGATLVRVLHHLEQPGRALTEIARILAPTGRLVANYRNRRDLRNLVRFALRLPTHGPFQDAHDDPTGSEQLQAYTHPRAFDRAVAEAGLRIRRRRGSSFLGGKISRILPGAVALDRLISPLVGRPALAPLIFAELEHAVRGEASAAGHASLADILVCPACRGSLDERDAGYHCASCGKAFEEKDGIIDFRGNGSHA
jgi:SAM-dependent methyltransferase